MGSGREFGPRQNSDVLSESSVPDSSNAGHVQVAVKVGLQRLSPYQLSSVTRKVRYSRRAHMSDACPQHSFCIGSVLQLGRVGYGRIDDASVSRR